MREDARWPLVIETLEATDQDEGRFGQVIYKLDDQLDDGKSSTISDVFAIETQDGKGVISLIGKLDYEQKSLYQLRILAVDRAIESERLTTTTSILISVEDCEDQPPMFTFVPSITRIPENLAVGSNVVRVTAIDGDRGVNNPIKYSLISVNGNESGPESAIFSLDPQTGQIQVAHELDRELTSAPSAGFWSSSSAIGDDYSRSASNKNSVPSQPGSFVLQVRATEMHQTNYKQEAESSVSTELTIILTDVNDEAPKFSRPIFYGEILENSASDSLVTFVNYDPSQSSGTPTTGASTTLLQQPDDGNLAFAKVFDRDQGTNGTFTLRLEGQHAHLFDIWPKEATNEANLLIKVASDSSLMAESKGSNSQAPWTWLDYEKTKQFQFDIIAREKFVSANAHDNLQLESSATMTVFVKDTNDNYPQFDTDIYRVEIPENAIRGMHICVVKATDADSGIFGTQGIRYTELRGEKANKFKLDPLTGIITLKTSDHGFDRESVAQYTLIIEARDSNGMGNRNTSQLLISITDINDQRPKFLLDQYEAFIYENELDFQSPPLQVQAIDNDAPNTANSKITYSIIAGDPQQNFTIDPLSGRIRIRNSLILANSSTSKPNMMNGGYMINEVELHSEMDPDNQPYSNGSVASGVVAVAQSSGLDFESIPQKRDETRQFNLTIKATDSGVPEPLSGLAHVIIVVYDKNDHAPVFTRSIYSKSIREDIREGSQVLQVLALDGDHSPTNSKITYRISSGAADKFVIDSDSGLISVANGANLDIDRIAGASKRTNYLLSVLAMDGSFGPNQKSASCLVNITIIDVNNKSPEFVSLGASLKQNNQALLATMNQQQQHIVYINEDAPYGLIVTRVVATDLDSTAELRYSINYARSEARNDDMVLVDPNLMRDVFAIDPSDGTIKVVKQLDRELFDQVKLRLQVEDIAAETNGQIGYSYLTVKITDVNDNRPTFKQPIYKAVVNENSIAGTSILTITADDRDLNKTLKYSLDGQAEMLRLVRINPRSGEITVNDKIDREMYPLINVTVRAEDFGLPHSLSGTSQVLITVRDENDNNPIFLNQTRMAPPVSSHQIDMLNTRLTLNHRMSTNNGMDTLGPSGGSRFRSLAAPELISAETTSSTIDSAGGPFIGKTHVIPFLAPGSTVKIREDSPIGLQVAYVRAEDADIDSNGRVTYMMDPMSSGGKFRINRDSGIISVAGQLDREQVTLYSLIIEACDNYDLGYSSGESRRAFTQVNIMLTDVNDNAPVINTNIPPNGGLRQMKDSQVVGSSSEASGGVRSSISGYPSHDDIVNSPGPYETPMQDCVFINEFQALNEPILTLVVNDADDPNLDNGKVDLAIINNPSPLPENSLFAIIPTPAATHSNQDRISTRTTSSNNEHTVNLDRFQPALPSIRPTTAIGPDPSSAVAIDSNDTEASLEPRYTSTHVIHISPDGSNTDTIHDRVKRSSFARSYGSSLFDSGNHHRTQTSSTGSSVINHRSGRGLAEGNVLDYEPFRSDNGATQRPTPLTLSPISMQPEIGEQRAYLVVSKSLKEKIGNYSVLVRATDRGQPSLSTVKRVNICVQDVNNHAPVFHRPPLNHTIRIMENATIGSFVTQVEATDLDHGLNGELQYSFKATNIPNTNNDYQAFKIDRITGIVTTTKSFNRQIKKYYTLRVQAQDFGRPTSLSSDIDINIMIVNSGLYQPEFANQIQVVNFTENVPIGTEWITVIPTSNQDDDPALISAIGNKSQAKDNGLDWPQSSPCYFIVDGDDHEQIFHLDRYTHRLTNQKLIDREKKSNYTLVIQASNNCQQPNILNSNVLLRNSVNTDSSQTSNVDRMAKQLVATAPSDTHNQNNSTRAKRSFGGSSIKRQLISPNSSGFIHNTLDSISTKLSPSSSSASSQNSLESSGNFDSLLTGDKSLLKLFIKINDVNDNAPKFMQKVYTGGITTEADFGTVFMIVQAIDLDAEANGQIFYSIVKPIRRNLATGMTSITGGTNENNQDPSTSSVVSKRVKRTEQTAVIHSSSSSSSDNRALKPAKESIDHEQVVANNSIASNVMDVSSFTNVDGDDLFVINAQTGEISLNFDPQKHMKGYFEFEILANDTDGLSDSSMVYIYLLRQDQRVKFILRLTPQELRARLNKFRSVLGNITGAIVNIDSYKYYENQDGTVDKKKTSLYLHFVNPDDNTIIDVDKVLTLIDNNIEYLDELYKEFHVLSSEAASLPLSGSALIDPIDQVRTGLMGVCSFLGLILILVIALCLNQRTRYERQLKAATVSAFNGSPLHLDPEYHRQTNLPNTNLHSQDPNPIWMNGFAIEQHSDWLSGAAGNAFKRPSNGCSVSPTTTPNSRAQNINLAIETDADYLSSNSGGAKSCDLNSLSGHHSHTHSHLQHQHQHNHLHRYNAATTATPRTDSLNSNSNCDDSTGSGSNSNSGSASTTNERQALFAHRDRANQNSQRATTLVKTANVVIGSKPLDSLGNNNSNNNQHQTGKRMANEFKRRRSHQVDSNETDATITSNNTIGHHSTFGAFKEVTIYTDNNHHPPNGASNLVTMVNQQHNNSAVIQRHQQQPQRQAQNKILGQVNKIASQFNAQHLAQTNGQSHIYISAGHQQPSNDRCNSNGNHQQSHRVIVHPNGADINQGIIVSRPGGDANLDIRTTTSQLNGSNPSDNNFEENLSKLSILNLETTEL